MMRVLCTALFLYLVAMTAVLVAKPDRLYDRKTRQYRPFGTAAGATLTPLWLVALLAAVGAYATASIALSYPSVAALLPFVGRGGVASAAATGTPSGTVAGSTLPAVSASSTRTAPVATSVTPVSPPTRPASSSSHTSALPAAPPLYEFRQPEAAGRRAIELLRSARESRWRELGLFPVHGVRRPGFRRPAGNPGFESESGSGLLPPPPVW